MIDRPVALVCTGYGTHPVRELVVLSPVRGRPDLDVMREDAGMSPRTPSDDERRGFGVGGSVTTVEPGSRRVRRKADAQLVNKPGIGWQVVGSGCPTCSEPAMVQRVAMIAAYVAAHFAPGSGRVDVDLRAPMR